jgi:adenylate cyclase
MAEERVERRLAAILAADVAGYSRLMERDEVATMAALKTQMSEVIVPAIAELHGRIVKTMGDGFIAEFRSVVDAVGSAAAIQRRLAVRNAEAALDKRLELRVGVNLGDVVVEGSDLMGDGVNIAARLEGVAKPGAICLSEQAYWQVKGRLDLKVTDLGATPLKNIGRWRWIETLPTLTR